ncbi:MAG: hypothetical protein HWN65_08815 [Candidatus Helarchaeota archaeon]|nr:hypothetical protein [Candidatus Helarchaeota archaeon]
MPYILTTIWYPPDKHSEVEKIAFANVPKYPPRPELGEMVVPTMVTADINGIKAMSVFKAKKGKYDEVMAIAGKQLSEFWGIEGLRYTLETLYTAEEAWAVVGKKVPG